MISQPRPAGNRWLLGGNDIRSGEGRAVLAGGLMFFFLLTSLMVLRPAREALGLERGVEGVRRLFLVTVVCTLPLAPLFGWLVSRCSRRRLVGLSLRLCALILLGFYAGLTLLPEGMRSLVAGSYYVFHSVFNLFVVSVFWAFMADYFNLAESKRLFPAITLGGSLGAILGSLISWQLAEFVGVSALFLLAAALLELAVWVATLFSRTRTVTHISPVDTRPIGGSWVRGDWRDRAVSLFAGGRAVCGADRRGFDVPVFYQSEPGGRGQRLDGSTDGLVCPYQSLDPVGQAWLEPCSCCPCSPWADLRCSRWRPP